MESSDAKDWCTCFCFAGVSDALVPQRFWSYGSGFIVLEVYECSQVGAWSWHFAFFPWQLDSSKKQHPESPEAPGPSSARLSKGFPPIRNPLACGVPGAASFQGERFLVDVHFTPKGNQWVAKARVYSPAGFVSFCLRTEFIREDPPVQSIKWPCKQMLGKHLVGSQVGSRCFSKSWGPYEVEFPYLYAKKFPSFQNLSFKSLKNQQFDEVLSTNSQSGW